MTLEEFYKILSDKKSEGLFEMISPELIYLYIKDKNDFLYCPITYVASTTRRCVFRLDQVYQANDLIDLERFTEVLAAIQGTPGEIRDILCGILGVGKDPLKQLVPKTTWAI